jgi:inhibitor of KinA sporulation pathway (predicted exonuclease)
MMFARGKNPSGGLASAMGTFKLQFKGTAHRADIDAVNTLALFFKFLERQRGLENLLHDAKVI